MSFGHWAWTLGTLKSALTAEQRIAFRRRLLSWYASYGRDLPWRRTRDPYAILVSEVMLQQTQVTTVIPFYHRWLARFPTIDALAAAPETDVLHAWQGLGYYTRARNLHSTAKLIVRQYHGVVPREPADIRRLPGLGRYTSNAVATFAFNKSVPIVEANITRVIARLFNIGHAVDSSAGRERLWQSAESLVSTSNAANFNSALMDLGALICLRKPRCTMCPVRSFCRAPKPERLPITKPRPQSVHLTESHALVRRGNNFLLEKCSRRWRGMWMLPPLRLASTGKPIHSAVFAFTHHRVTLQVFRQHNPRVHRGQKWVPIDQLDRLPIPSPHRRAITACLSLSASSRKHSELDVEA